MRKKLPTINLLRNQEKSPLEKFLNWAFTVGRVIVIVTESIALSAFAYRFVLDKEIIDLRDKIKQEQIIVTLSQQNEEKFRNLQNRLALANRLEEKQQKTTFLASLLKIATNRASFTKIDIGENSLLLEGVAASIGTLSDFARELRSLPLVASVSINTIQANTTERTIRFTISAVLKGENNEN
jgi:Tfp pilus assembly protein PilN